MVKKKIVKKTKSKKSSHVKSKSISKKASKSSSLKTKGPTEKKSKIVTRNIALFGALFLLSVALYYFSGTDEILSNFFWILALVMGGVTAAFVIAHLIFYFMKSFKK